MTALCYFVQLEELTLRTLSLGILFFGKGFLMLPLRRAQEPLH